MTVPSILVDKRNWDQLGPLLKDKISEAAFTGFDYETNDDRRHDGLNQLCGYDPQTRMRKEGKKLVFDFRRTDICGASFYPENDNAAYYVNLGHADVENRLSYDDLRSLLAAKKSTSYWVAHNAPFEIAVTRAVLNMPLDNIICTLQQCVSAYGPHEYDRSQWLYCGAAGIGKLIPDLVRASLTDFPNPEKMEMGPRLSELAYKVIAKESDSEWSYNGLVKGIAYGYGLKQAIASHFNHRMGTFKETLRGRAHMGLLTGEETAEYGAEDAYWAIRLFRHLFTFMSPDLLKTFFEQENPMVQHYADLKIGGMRVNATAIMAQQDIERVNAASTLRTLRAAIEKLLPFPDEPHEGLMKYDEWYQKNHKKYRAQIVDWVNWGDHPDDHTELSRARGSVSNKWLAETGQKAVGPNFSHYMPIRTVIYDLIRTKVIAQQGKTQGDGEARGKLITRLSKEEGREWAVKAIESINALSSIDQRVKLYITPYRLLIDPETDRMYPTISSMLATRRMAGSDPNGMQLAKRGESVFVRGYFEADNEDHVLISIDWSAVELVEIGEFSEDDEFIDAFATLPHQDLHAGSAAAILSVEVPEMDVARFKALRTAESWESWGKMYSYGPESMRRLRLNLKGEPLEINKSYGYWRTEIGKGANFNYWYSGWLATIGERMGWGPDRTAEATDAYRMRFPQAENWRTNLISQVQRDGYIVLPDGHRYVRYESTLQWFDEWCSKFIQRDALPELDNYHSIIRWMGRKIAKRGGNQAVNAYIQGTCATIAKRSIIRIVQGIRARGWDARFIQPIHDELLFSVHRSIAAEFVTFARGIMIDHPDLFKRCKLDASPSVGLNFAPWNEKKARLGQVELFEPPAEVVGEEKANKRLDEAGMTDVVNWLFDERKAKQYAQAA